MSTIGLVRILAACLALLLAIPAAYAQEGGPGAAAENQYRLGPGDVLRITVYGETELTGEYPVGAGGAVAFPLVGDVTAADLTPQQFAEALAARLSQGFLVNPRVSAAVLTYRPFFILGEVQRPGSYPYQADLTVLGAVATAGGFTYRANRRRVFIKHAGESEEQALRLDDNTRVRPGDTIRIGERFF